MLLSLLLLTLPSQLPLLLRLLPVSVFIVNVIVIAGVALRSKWIFLMNLINAAPGTIRVILVMPLPPFDMRAVKGISNGNRNPNPVRPKAKVVGKNINQR